MKKSPIQIRTRHFLFLLALAVTATTRADVKPNSLFSDNAVLQRGQEVPVWGTARTGEKVTVSFGTQSVSTVATGGAWMVRLKPMNASETPQNMTIAGDNTVTLKNILVGEVWLCSGQSNMERQLGPRPPQQEITNWKQEVEEANYPEIRQFKVTRLASETPVFDANGTWIVCSPHTADKFTAVGYFFAHDLFKAIHVPIGVLYSTWGGTPAEAWTRLQAIENNPDLLPIAQAYQKAITEFPEKLAQYQKDAAANMEKNKAAASETIPVPPLPGPPKDPQKYEHSPATLYNGMIAPLQPYAIRGVCWYQGESNSGRGKQYETLFPIMIVDWRTAWGESAFPFLFVQIASFKTNTPDVREAQLKTFKTVPNTAMAVITDVSDPNDIHPPHKQEVGARLALAARALAYGEKIEFSGPVFDKMDISGGKAVISFTHAGDGLVAKDGPLKGFLIAGSDKTFVPATAEISASTITVSSPEVPSPAAVRFGYENTPDVNLFNKAGLPASPFRTDDWRVK